MQKLEVPRRRDVVWLGDSQRELASFPQSAKLEMATALEVAACGDKHPSAKPWKGVGPGVFEIVEDFDGNAYRAVYTVRFKGALYVLHAFQKKSTEGKKTPLREVNKVAARLAWAQKHHRENYDDAKNKKGR